MGQLNLTQLSFHHTHFYALKHNVPVTFVFVSVENTLNNLVKPGVKLKSNVFELRFKKILRFIMVVYCKIH